MKRGKQVIPVGQIKGNPFTSSQWTRVGNNYYTFGSSILLNGGDTSNPYTNYIKLTDYPSTLQKQSITVIFTINTLTSDGTNDGFWFGFQSVAQFDKGNLFVKFDGGTGGNKGKISLFYNFNGTINSVASDSSMTISNGDTISIKFDINNEVCTITKQNITQSLNPAPLVFSTGLYNTTVVGAGYGIQNLSCPAIGVINCNLTITSYSWDTTLNKNEPYMVVGDSISQGCFSGAANQTFASLLGYPTLSGASDTTQDIITSFWQLTLLKPKNIILGIGINDVSNGVSSGTWQANYASIVSTIQGMNIGLKLNTEIPNGTIPTWATYVTSTYSASMIYDTYAVLDSGSGNNIFTGFVTVGHPNQQGHKAMYYRILYPTISKYTIRYIATLTTIPSSSLVTVYDTFITQCITDGNWNLIDRLWLFAQGTQADSKISMANPLSTQATEVSSPSWIANQGYTGNGSSSYLDSKFVPSTDGINYILNSASFGVYSRTSNAGAIIQEMGLAVTAGSTDNLYCYFTDNKAYGKINTLAGAGFANGAVANSQGLFSVVRSSNLSSTLYRNGISISTAVDVSSTLSNISFFICAINGAGTASQFSNRQLSMAFIGGGGIDQTKFYSAFQTMATSLGFQV